MVYIIQKKPNGRYRVLNKDTKEVKAKDTTRTKAEKQVRLLYWIDSKKK